MSEKDGDTEVTRAAFRAYDEHSSVRNRTPWQIWRDACAWCWQAARKSASAPGQEPIYAYEWDVSPGVVHRDFEYCYHNGRYPDRTLTLYAAPIGDNRADTEAEQRRKMQERFAQRPQTPATEDFDLPAPNDAIGDNGAKACPCLEWADAIQAKLKTKPLVEEPSQPANSKRMTRGDILVLWDQTMDPDDGETREHELIVRFAEKLLARASAKGE